MDFPPEELLCFSPLPLKNSTSFTLTPKEFHHFYPLPLKNSAVPQPRGCQNWLPRITTESITTSYFPLDGMLMQGFPQYRSITALPWTECSSITG